MRSIPQRGPASWFCDHCKRPQWGKKQIYGVSLCFLCIAVRAEEPLSISNERVKAVPMKFGVMSRITQTGREFWVEDYSALPEGDAPTSDTSTQRPD